MAHTSREGMVEVPGGKVWFEIVGGGDATPLLTLHGGPGAGHDYLESLEALTDERPVILYDQLGCGKSDAPDDVSLWHIERYVQELEAVRVALGLERVHLFGHSWGGWLALSYMLTTNVKGVASLILASTSASLPQFAEETAKLRATLPQDVLDVMEKYEAAGDYQNEKYEEAVMAFMLQFVFRGGEIPEPIIRTMQNHGRNPVPYQVIQGPNEFTITGNLKDWDMTSRLKEIRVPTLITCGKYDEMGPPCATTLQQGIPNSEMVVFENSAHMAHWEEQEEYIRVLREFLRRVDEGGGSAG